MSSAVTSQYSPSDTPNRAFPALKTPLPMEEESIGEMLRRGERLALSNIERLKSLSAKLAGYERLVAADAEQ